MDVLPRNRYCWKRWAEMNRPSTERRNPKRLPMEFCISPEIYVKYHTPHNSTATLEQALPCIQFKKSFNSIHLCPSNVSSIFSQTLQSSFVAWVLIIPVTFTSVIAQFTEIGVFFSCNSKSIFWLDSLWILIFLLLAMTYAISHPLPSQEPMVLEHRPLKSTLTRYKDLSRV